MRTVHHQGEKGVALLLSILALLALTAVAAGMIYMSATETAINSNFKNEETAFFSARAGIEEVRDRMLSINANTINAQLPTALLPGIGSALYVLQSGVAMSNVTAISSDPLADDELCHDLMSSVPANVPCKTLPAGTAWYQTPLASVAPYPLDYKWVRITLKQNNSTGSRVDTAQINTNQVCWNGISEVVAPAGTACSALNPIANPVYMLTALAVTNSSNNSGARRLMQEEIAQTPVGGLPGGLFATSPGCGALGIAGNAETGSFNSSTEGTPTNPPSNRGNSDGDVGANGGVSVGGTSTDIHGKISTLLPAAVGTCPTDGVTKTGNPTWDSLAQLNSAYTPPVPPTPNPLPPTTNVTYKNTTLTAGSYGNVTMKGTVTLTPGTVNNPAVYVMNSLTLNGNATLVITGPVVINIAGVGVSTPVDMTGGSFSNTTYVPSDFVINYGGTGGLVVTGGNEAYSIINAPNAAITFRGGSDFYGQAIGKTIDDQGGTNFWWDKAAYTPPVNNNSYYEISMRELAY